MKLSLKRKIPVSIMFMLVAIFFTIFNSCKNKTDNSEENINNTTPVTITGISTEKLDKYEEFCAYSKYLKKSKVRSSIAGIIINSHVNQGEAVIKGTILFSIKTREAVALTEDKNTLDTNLNFSGNIKITAPRNGIVDSVFYQKGDYIQEGDELASIIEPESFAFITLVPFDMLHLIKKGKHCKIVLPDNSTINGIVGSTLPNMDFQSQNVKVLVKPLKKQTFPQNLMAKVNLIIFSKPDVYTLPKDAILSDESLKNFWVMKLLNDSVAIKVPIKKGVEINDRVEILNPVFQKNDRIILSGNYGLEDTAKVIIIR